MLVSIVLISGIIAFWEIPPLIINKMWKEFFTLIIMLLIAIILVVQKRLGLPTPLVAIADFLDPLGRLIFKKR